jgi:hypothetical protein
LEQLPEQMELHSNDIGIGIEKEIYSDSYFSYHYGYKKLKSHCNKRIEKSKISLIEKDLFSLFKNINFDILFLNFSRRGTFVNFVLKDYLSDEEKTLLSIKPYGNTRSFTIPVNNKELKHREIYPMLKLNNLNDFDLSQESKEKICEMFESCDARFFCLGFDVHNQVPNFNDLHVEIYSKKNIYSCEKSLKYLQNCGCKNTLEYEKYFYDFPKFSHIKFRVLNNEIKNIKYYRSINVNLLDFYNGK